MSKSPWKTAIAASFSVGVLVFTSVARTVTEVLREHNLLRITVYSLYVLALILVWIWVRKNQIRSISWITLAVSLGLLVILMSISETPEEKIHFLQFGVASWVFIWTFENRLSALIFAFILGGADEALQALLPTRYFEWRDMCSNFAGSGLGFAIHQAVSRKKLL